MASKRWQDWVNLILGLWTIASPWILGLLEGEPAVVWSAWTLGASIVVFAVLAMFTAFGVWAMLRNIDLQKWWHGHYRTR
jgi:hypothetical protein